MLVELPRDEVILVNSSLAAGQRRKEREERDGKEMEKKKEERRKTLENLSYCISARKQLDLSNSMGSIARKRTNCAHPQTTHALGSHAGRTCPEHGHLPIMDGLLIHKHRQQ